MIHRSLAVALILTIASIARPEPVRADIYRCAEADGSVHFTNVRPGGRRCRLVVRSSPRRASRGGGLARRSPQDRSPERVRRYDTHIREAARLYLLPESFIRAVVKVESNFSSGAVSRDGAMGLMQLMPQTAAAMGVTDPFDPRQNVLGGARYLRVLANKFNGDLVLTVAAYNAGEHAVVRYRGVPPYPETRRYVQNVLRHYYAYRTASP